MSFRIMLVTALVGLFAVSMVLTAEEPAVVTVKGVVTACAETCKTCPCSMKDADGVVYKVSRNAVGEKLAKEANGKTVEAKGTVATKDDAKWLTVKEYKLVEAAAK